MKISGFTFIRNGFKLQYPFLESIRSVLPVCDEMVIAVGNSDDGTRKAIAGLHHTKIRIIDTVWDDSLRAGGQILAQQTNIALDHITGDWGFYIQGDEVVHENDLQRIIDEANKHVTNQHIDGLLFSWLHFFGNYNYIAKPLSRGVYPFEVRLIKNNRLIRSFSDAQGFRKHDSVAAMKNYEAPVRLNVKAVDARIFHYGKVRGPESELMRAKTFHRLWHPDEWVEKFSRNKSVFEYSRNFPIQYFNGTHPAVMKERIETTNWNFDPQPSDEKIPIKYKMLNLLQEATGWRPFEFRNYKTVL